MRYIFLGRSVEVSRPRLQMLIFWCCSFLEIVHLSRQAGVSTNRNLSAIIFSQGRLFAWHLYLEAKSIFSQNETPFLYTLGAPAEYSTMEKDIDDLEQLLQEAISELKNGTKSVVYELGIIYTAIRDIAMSASWSYLGRPCFSIDAPYKLPNPCPLKNSVYKTAMLARHSSTRGAVTLRATSIV